MDRTGRLHDVDLKPTPAHRLSPSVLNNLADRFLGVRRMSLRAAGAFRQPLALYRPLPTRPAIATQSVGSALPDHVAATALQANRAISMRGGERADKGKHPKMLRANAAGRASTLRSLAPGGAMNVNAHMRPNMAGAGFIVRPVAVRQYTSALRNCAAIRPAIPAEYQRGGYRGSRADMTRGATVAPRRIFSGSPVPELRTTVAGYDANGYRIQSLAPIGRQASIEELRRERSALPDRQPPEGNDFFGGVGERSRAVDPYPDRSELARWMTDYLERQILRPRLGMTGVDPRMTPF